MKIKKPTYLLFGLDKENYAIPTKKVLEVLEPQLITPFPNAPDYIKGIIGFRGNIIPVICLRRTLNLNENNIQKYVLIIFDSILNQKKTLVAAIADNVNEIVAAGNTEILPVTEKGINFNTDFATGMLENNKKSISEKYPLVEKFTNMDCFFS